MAQIKIRFVTDNSLSSKIVKWYDRGYWSHTEIVLPNGDLLGARYIKGVQIRPKNYMKPTSLGIISVFVSEKELSKFYNVAFSQIGRKYDWLDILGFLDESFTTMKNRWICSEYVTWCFKKIGLFYKPIPEELGKITPDSCFLLLSQYGDYKRII